MEILMTDLTLASFGNGEIRYISKVDAVPTTSETNGNVTVKNMGRDEIPGHFETSFMIQVKIEESGIDAYSSFHWHDVVLADQADVSYRSIEDKAARRIAPMLRTLADRLDQAMAEFDQREAARIAAR